ncbi:uncharacterized protein FYW47_006951 [Aplochiton taeniatus]
MGGQAKSKKKSKPKRRDTGSDGGSFGLSPQDRMKQRMHEKAKKKSAEKYSVLQLLEKTEEYMDSFDFEMAARFCQRALDLAPSNLQTLDMLGNICSELGDIPRAKEISLLFLRAVELSPDEGHSKYMYLGQIHTAQEAVNYYTKGIQILQSVLDKQTHITALAGAAALPPHDPDLPTPKDLCVAYCSVAEIYLTDLCMEDGAGDKCRESVERALHYHNDNPEALQLMASYLFSTERNEEGKQYLIKSVGMWLPAQKERESSATADQELVQNDGPPYESRITTAKLLIETEEYETAVDVLEGLLEEDDEVVQVWYLSGWVCHLQMEKAREQRAREQKEATEEEQEECQALREAARSYLTKAKKLYGKLRCDDQPLLEHVEQLLAELGGEMEGDDGEGEPALDDDYEPSSDEDEEEAPMEH